MKNIMNLIQKMICQGPGIFLITACLLVGSNAHASDLQCDAIEKSNINPRIIASMLEAANRGQLYRVDSDTSNIAFKVKHFPFSTIDGSFQEFDGALTMTEENHQSRQALFLIKVDSIATGDRELDDYLKSSAFFDVRQFPDIVFVSTGFEWINETTARLQGQLTLRGTTRPQVFIMQIAQSGYYPPAATPSLIIHASAEIRRSEFGMDGLALLVSDTVKFNIRIAASRAGS